MCRRIRLILGTLAGPVALTACSGDGVPGDAAAVLSVVVDTVAGVEHVRSGGSAPEWRLEPLLTLGSAGSVGVRPADDEFAWVSGVALDADGNLYVADLGSSEIRVFDLAGTLLRRIGREGAGPGEFRTLYSIQWLGDTLVTLDHGNGRIGFLSRDGTWLDSQPFVGRLTDSPVTTRLYAAGARELYSPGYDVADGIVRRTWRRHLPATPMEEWPRRPATVASPFPDQVVCTRGRGFSWFEHPYATRALEHPAPGRAFHHATSDAYRVALVDFLGDTVRVVERATAPVALTDADWNALMERFETWLEDKDRTRCRPPALTRPEHRPAIESLMVDVSGRLWVETHRETGTAWEIFDRAGRLVGSVAGFGHDRRRTVPWLGDTHVAWVRRDSLDVPSVHVARLVR